MVLMAVFAQPAFAQLDDLDDVLNILVSPEPQYRGVADLVNQSYSYFPRIFALAKKRSKSEYGEYAALDEWAKQKLEEHRELVEKGEAYQSEYYRKMLEGPANDPVVFDIRKRFSSVIATLRAAAANQTPPLYTHPDAARVVNDQLNRTSIGLDRDYNPDIYKQQSTRGTSRLMQSPDYARAGQSLQGDLNRAIEQLEAVQIDSYKNFLLSKSKTLTVSASPVEDLDDIYLQGRSQIFKVNAQDIANFKFKVAKSKWGYSRVYAERMSDDGNIEKIVFGHQESSQSWRPYQAHGGTALLHEEKFLGALETDLISGKVSEEELRMGLLKSYGALASSLRKDLDKVTSRRQLTPMADEQTRKLSAFTQHPERSAFTWQSSHGISEYRSETRYYNRLMNGVVWAGRAQDTQHGTDYWNRRDLQATLNGKPSVQSALTAVPISRSKVKAHAIRSANWLGNFFDSLQKHAAPGDLGTQFGRGNITNTPKKQIEKAKNTPLFAVERLSAEDNASLFRIPEPHHYDKQGETVTTTPEQLADIKTRNLVRQIARERRLPLSVPRGYLANDVAIFDEKNNELPREEWQLKRDPQSGHFWVELSGEQNLKKGFFIETKMRRNSRPTPSAAALERVLVRDLGAIADQNLDLREAGFTVLADQLDHLVDAARNAGQPLSISELEAVFVQNSQYSYKKEKSPLFAKKPNRVTAFSEFSRFAKDGILCGQCDSGNELFATYLKKYFEDDPRVSVTTESVYSIDGKSTLITSGDRHAVTVVRVDGEEVALSDATPASNTLKRLEQERRAEEEEIKKATEDLKHDEKNQEKVDNDTLPKSGRPIVKNKASIDQELIALRNFSRHLGDRIAAVEKTLPQIGKVISPQVRRQLTETDPLGLSLSLAKKLERFLKQPYSPQTLVAFATDLSLKNPESRSLEDCLKHVGLHSETIILPDLKAVALGAPRREHFFKQVPALRSSATRDAVDNLANALMRSPRIVNESALNKLKLVSCENLMPKALQP